MASKTSNDELQQKIRALEKEIKQLKQKDNETKDVKGFLDSLLQDAPVFLVALNFDGKVVLMNKTMLDFLGYTLREVRGKDYLSNFIPDADKKMVSGTLKKLIESKGPTLNVNRVAAKDGRELPLEWHGRQVFQENGTLDYCWCLGIGIAERTKNEKRLAASEEKLNAIIRTVPDIIYRLDTKGRLTFISDSVLHYGYQPQALLGKYLVDMVHPDDKKKTANRLNERRTGKRSTRTLEIRLMLKNQGPDAFKHFLISAEGLYASSVPDVKNFIGSQGIARDISGRKQAETERLHREKLKGVVEMAGAICHELNQPLMAISGYSELVLMEMSENDPLVGKIDKIIEQIDKLGRITQKLMKITRYETKDYLEGKIIDIDKATE